MELGQGGSVIWALYILKLVSRYSSEIYVSDLVALKKHAHNIDVSGVYLWLHCNCKDVTHLESLAPHTIKALQTTLFSAKIFHLLEARGLDVMMVSWWFKFQTRWSFCAYVSLLWWHRLTGYTRNCYLFFIELNYGREASCLRDLSINILYIVTTLPLTISKVCLMASFTLLFQVLKGDIKSAIELHEVFYSVAKRHTFLPEVKHVKF